MPPSNFLPEDYVNQQAERRSNAFGLILFIIVMISVVGAFLVTNRQWTNIKAKQKTINTSYADAAKQIETLNELETQKKHIMDKAEVAEALVERVPRSVLLAELINRIPDAICLDSFEMKSTKPIIKKAPVSTKAKVKSIKKSAPDAAEDSETENQVIEVPRYHTTISLIGYAPTDLHVSDYINSLGECPLISSIQLKYSREIYVEEQNLRKFKLELVLDPNADANGFEPIKFNKSLRNPMEVMKQMESFTDSLTNVDLEHN